MNFQKSSIDPQPGDVLICGRVATGKTYTAIQLAAHFGCHSVVDEWYPQAKEPESSSQFGPKRFGEYGPTLFLTQEEPLNMGAYPGVRVYRFRFNTAYRVRRSWIARLAVSLLLNAKPMFHLYWAGSEQ